MKPQIHHIPHLPRDNWDLAGCFEGSGCESGGGSEAGYAFNDNNNMGSVWLTEKPINLHPEGRYPGNGRAPGACDYHGKGMSITISAYGGCWEKSD